jgi:hypothetical protein
MPYRSIDTNEITSSLPQKNQTQPTQATEGSRKIFNFEREQSGEVVGVKTSLRQHYFKFSDQCQVNKDIFTMPVLGGTIRSDKIM